MDSEQPEYEDNIRTIVDYLKLPTSNVMTGGNTVDLDIVESSDNNSFGAMDSGQSKLR